MRINQPRKEVRVSLVALALGVQPAPVGVAEHPDEVWPDTAHASAVGATQQALGGEQRHLGVVGDGAGLARIGDEVADPCGPEAGADLGQGHELHRRAECVANGATEEAAAESGLPHGVNRNRRAR